MLERSRDLLETATAWTLGPPLVLYDWLSDRFGRAGERLDEEAERVASKVRAEAREALDEARDWVSEQDSRPYEARTAAELYELARERDIEGRSSMSKEELISALREAR